MTLLKQIAFTQQVLLRGSDTNSPGSQLDSGRRSLNLLSLHGLLLDEGIQIQGCIQNTLHTESGRACMSDVHLDLKQNIVCGFLDLNWNIGCVSFE